MSEAAAGTGDCVHFEYHEAAAPPADSALLRVAAYNIERGRRLDAILGLWCAHPARHNDVVLLSEVDIGMARSGNRHVAREFAAALGYSWAYAAEFHELTKGGREERRLPGENSQALHGNAIISRYPLRRIEVVPLPAFFDYREQFLARIGSRNAIVADIETPGGRYTLASTHLEAVSSARQRCAQLAAICAALARRDTGQPLIVGGDMNTTCLDARRLTASLLARPWLAQGPVSLRRLCRYEPMFALLDQQGYDYRAANVAGYTFSDKGYRARLDWLFVRNLEPARVREAAIYRAFLGSRRYSDHLPVAAAFAAH